VKQSCKLKGKELKLIELKTIKTPIKLRSEATIRTQFDKSKPEKETIRELNKEHNPEHYTMKTLIKDRTFRIHRLPSHRRQ
jgi:hypothetical protein